MIFDKEYFDILIREVSLDEYENLECREILKIMIELYQKAEDLDEDLLYKRVKELPGIDTGLLSLIFERPINFLPENIDQMIKDLITTLKINKLETKRNNIKKEIEELERKSVRNSNEDERFLKLCIELTNLNKELNLMRYEEGR